MPIDEFIINIYLMVEQYYKIVVTKPLRSAGYAPKLSDPEVICMEMVGEFLHLDQDKQIWQYFTCLLYTSPSPRDKRQSRMPSSA